MLSADLFEVRIRCRYCLYLSLESSVMCWLNFWDPFSTPSRVRTRVSLWRDTVVMETPNQKYTTNDYERLFLDIGFPKGYDMFRGIEQNWHVASPTSKCTHTLLLQHWCSYAWDFQVQWGFSWDLWTGGRVQGEGRRTGEQGGQWSVSAMGWRWRWSRLSIPSSPLSQHSSRGSVSRWWCAGSNWWYCQSKDQLLKSN